MDLRQQTEEILKALGGEENIHAATHCVTRLRLALNDEEQVDKEKLESLDVVRGSFSTNGQFQVVIGQGTVDKVYKELMSLTNMEQSSKEDVKTASAQKMNPLQRAIKTLADIFIPILPAIVTAGLLLGINNILVNPGIFYDEQSVIDVFPQWADVTNVIAIIANTAFTFLPALIGWSAVKRFGGSELFGIVLGLILVHPDLLNAWTYGDAVKDGTVPIWNILGLEIEKIGYQGQVLPVLIASWVLARIEVGLRKVIPDSIQMLVVAPVSLLVTGFLTFIAIGPAMFAVGNGITDGLIFIFEQYAWLGGLIYGGIYPFLVVTGFHHTFLAVDIQLVGSTGTTFLWPMLALSNIAQGAAVFAMMLATKDENLRGLSGTSGVSAWLGVTEPAMFGVNIRYKFPFFAAVIGSALAGLYVTLESVKATSIGVGGVPGVFSIVSGFWFEFMIGMTIAIVIPFIVTFIIAKRRNV
ncbi:trehalose permease IIC protein [Pontibacillus halophilus JSM 076056 = DSM 19796]|uniref:Trehalose permease IIC protein n=1 Tax=Pontibacillus halophilus JSM 076056 = DSM 19796 TaxID=1385510 RepID=A0A0A5IAM7_9BACI|nr:PTS system trehalose-specific EIIBC component [Pontibacillus halophilus]KGX92892.1 trehalose permease IIC protein [Pontibacillus halophilus JSM 076056 = DSM 19796]